MSTPLFPKPLVPERIEILAQKFGLKIVNVEHTNSKALGRPRREIGDEKWEWSLSKPNSKVTIGIGFFFPSLISSVIFINSSPGGKKGHFFLENYLSSTLRYNPDYNRLRKVVVERSWKENWAVTLDILEEHLTKDLGQIINEEEWPDIPFNWQDYVEPAALDRIYEDQRQILNEEAPGKPQNAWIYFLDFFRKK